MLLSSRASIPFSFITCISFRVLVYITASFCSFSLSCTKRTVCGPYCHNTCNTSISVFVGTISLLVSFLNKLMNQRYVLKTYVAIVKVKYFYSSTHPDDAALVDPLFAAWKEGEK